MSSAFPNISPKVLARFDSYVKIDNVDFFLNRWINDINWISYLVILSAFGAKNNAIIL